MVGFGGDDITSRMSSGASDTFLIGDSPICVLTRRERLRVDLVEVIGDLVIGRDAVGE